jgi:hypothetical protein
LYLIDESKVVGTASGKNPNLAFIHKWSLLFLNTVREHPDAQEAKCSMTYNCKAGNKLIAPGFIFLFNNLFSIPGISGLIKAAFTSFYRLKVSSENNHIAELGFTRLLSTALLPATIPSAP